MKLLGKFTGKVYEDTTQFINFGEPECCIEITDEQARDKEYIKQQREQFKEECENCFVCLAASVYLGEI